PFEAAATPLVDVGDRDVDEEQDHHDQAEDPERVEVHRPGHQEDDLDVEDDEQHRRQVVLDREPTAAHGLRSGVDAALVGLEFGAVVALGPGDRSDDHRDDHEGGADTAEYEDGGVQLHRLAAPSGLYAKEVHVLPFSRDGSPEWSHAAGAILDRPLISRSIASPWLGSVRLASILRVKRIRRGRGSPYLVAYFMNAGLPIIFTK